MLFGSVFQLGYVTKDIDKACEMMARKYGISQFMRNEKLEMITDAGPMVLNLANSWVGQTWVEIIEPVDGNIALYSDWMPNGIDFRFHHIAHQLQSTDECDATRAEAAEKGIPLIFTMAQPTAQAFYFDTADEMGYYLEYLWFAPGSPILDAMPQNIEGFERVD